MENRFMYKHFDSRLDEKKIKERIEKVMVKSKNSYLTDFLVSAYSDLSGGYIVEVDKVCYVNCPGSFVSETYGQIIFDKKNGTYEVSEPFVKRSECPCTTQLNIFGTFKTLGGALHNLMKYGNTTHDGRKPKEIYV